MKSISPYLVDPDKPFKLADVDPDDRELFPLKKKEGKALLPELTYKLNELHRMLYREGKHKILIVIQTMDAGGKDGTVRNVFQPLDPMNFRMVSFKAPSTLERSYDYLWRVHQKVPRRGEIVVFNRSHYEDIIAVGVKNLAPKEVWERRFEHIVNFEKMLTDEGVTILKIYLHISKEEQRERFQSRIDEPEKNWKFNQADLDDRARWDEFMETYEEVINRTNTKFAPWMVVPANRKWHRNLVIADAVAKLMEGLDMKLPELDYDPKDFAVIE